MATVAALRDDGCTPLGVCAYLAGLGGRAPQSIESLDDLARSFALEGLSAAPSTFDRKQLDERDAAVAFSSRLGAAQLAVAVRAQLSVKGSPAALDELAELQERGLITPFKAAKLRAYFGQAFERLEEERTIGKRLLQSAKVNQNLTK